MSRELFLNKLHASRPATHASDSVGLPATDDYGNSVQHKVLGKTLVVTLSNRPGNERCW